MRQDFFLCKITNRCTDGPLVLCLFKIHATPIEGSGNVPRGSSPAAARSHLKLSNSSKTRSPTTGTRCDLPMPPPPSLFHLWPIHHHESKLHPKIRRPPIGIPTLPCRIPIHTIHSTLDRAAFPPSSTRQMAHSADRQVTCPAKPPAFDAGNGRGHATCGLNPFRHCIHRFRPQTWIGPNRAQVFKHDPCFRKVWDILDGRLQCILQ